MKRRRIGVIYGGRSGEHEVSLASAASVIANLDPARYEVVPIRIDRDGRWAIPDRPPTASSAGEVITKARSEPQRHQRSGREVVLVPHPGEETVITVERVATAGGEDPNARLNSLSLDVVFPVLHGPHGEDGTIQGLLELADVAYVGAGVLASAVGMDKVVMKTLFQARGLPIARYLAVHDHQWSASRQEVAAAARRRLRLPVFVKPANLGSSVGITKVKRADGLDPAIDLAFEYDRKVVIEAAVRDAREIECSVVGNDQPEASVPGEIVPSREFYDYEAKYVAESPVTIPAPLDPEVVSEVRRLAVEAFKAIDCAGMARVDFLLSRKTGRLVLNEINTIPGFTTISMFSKLWEASGVGYGALVDRLIDLALERHARKRRRTSVS